MGASYLIVVDMQNDFVDGSLGTPEAQAIVENVVRKVRSFPGHAPCGLPLHAGRHASARRALHRGHARLAARRRARGNPHRTRSSRLPERNVRIRRAGTRPCPRERRRPLGVHRAYRTVHGHLRSLQRPYAERFHARSAPVRGRTLLCGSHPRSARSRPAHHGKLPSAHRPVARLLLLATVLGCRPRLRPRWPQRFRGSVRLPAIRPCPPAPQGPARLCRWGTNPTCRMG